MQFYQGIAGGIGLKLADPSREVVVMLGDGSYLMANSELVTATMLGTKLIVVLLDNRGFGCINRLQHATGGERFNNLYAFNTRLENEPAIDFAAHARSLGAEACKVASLAELETALAAARAGGGTSVIVIDTDPMASTGAGGHWWDVAVPEVSSRPEVAEARLTEIGGLELFGHAALTVVGVDVGHGSIMFTSSGVLSCQAGDKPHSDQGSPRHLAMQASISMSRC